MLVVSWKFIFLLIISSLHSQNRLLVFICSHSSPRPPPLFYLSQQGPGIAGDCSSRFDGRCEGVGCELEVGFEVSAVLMDEEKAMCGVRGV